MDVSVIIVTYNTLQMTDECITSIVEKTKRVSYEIILVDNASTDGSKEFFEKDDRVTYIYNEENYGFGKANNVGASVAKGKYLFFLNSDTYLINDAIDKLFETRLSMSKNVGFIGGVLYDKCGVLNGYGAPFPSMKNALLNSYFLNRHHHMPPLHFNSGLKEIDYVVGADMFVSKELFNALNGFDERFFMYFEEADLQKRASERGYINYIIEGPRVCHFDGGSTGKTSLKKNTLIDRSLMLYMKLHNSIIIFNIFRFIYIIPRFSVFFKRRGGYKDKLNYIRTILSV